VRRASLRLAAKLAGHEFVTSGPEEWVTARYQEWVRAVLALARADEPGSTPPATRLLPDADFPAKDGGNHRSTSAMNTAESLPDEGNSGVVSRGGGSGMGPDGTRR
jgi:hypothetical protein